MDDFVMSVRAVRNGKFIPDVGPTKFLYVPEQQSPSPSHAKAASVWYKAVRSASVWKNAKGEERGDILFIVHGYNNSEEDVIARHRRLKADLNNEGFKGVVVSFDWPSDNEALAYLPDRHRAKKTALKLVSDGIEYLSGQQTTACAINIHVLGHSTGAYVIREAFDDADDTGLPNSGWSVSQIMLAAGDISSGSMSAASSSAESVYRHCVRLTNYFNRHDAVLDLSNVKRLGAAPRVGRIGLPIDAPENAVDVDCSGYYEELTKDHSSIKTTDQPDGFMGAQSHSWYFGNRIFTRDLFLTLIGSDRVVMPTREISAGGKISLKHI